jgi:hypothetical protein
LHNRDAGYSRPQLDALLNGATVLLRGEIRFRIQYLMLGAKE